MYAKKMCLYFFQDRLIDTDYVDDQLTKTDPVFCINNVIRRVFERSTLAICGVFFLNILLAHRAENVHFHSITKKMSDSSPLLR